MKIQGLQQLYLLTLYFCSTFVSADVLESNLGAIKLTPGLRARFYETHLDGTESQNDRLNFVDQKKYITEGEYLGEATGVTSIDTSYIKYISPNIYGFHMPSSVNQFVIELRGYYKPAETAGFKILSMAYAQQGCTYDYESTILSTYARLSNYMWLNQDAGNQVCYENTTNVNEKYATLFNEASSYTSAPVGVNGGSAFPIFQAGEYYPIRIVLLSRGGGFSTIFVPTIGSQWLSFSSSTLFSNANEDYEAMDANEATAFPGNCPQFSGAKSASPVAKFLDVVKRDTCPSSSISSSSSIPSSSSSEVPSSSSSSEMPESSSSEILSSSTSEIVSSSSEIIPSLSSSSEILISSESSISSDAASSSASEVTLTSASEPTLSSSSIVSSTDEATPSSSSIESSISSVESSTESSSPSSHASSSEDVPTSSGGEVTSSATDETSSVSSVSSTDATRSSSSQMPHDSSISSSLPSSSTTASSNITQSQSQSNSQPSISSSHSYPLNGSSSTNTKDKTTSTLSNYYTTVTLTTTVSGHVTTVVTVTNCDGPCHVATTQASLTSVLSSIGNENSVGGAQSRIPGTPEATQATKPGVSIVPSVSTTGSSSTAHVFSYLGNAPSLVLNPVVFTMFMFLEFL